MEDDLNYENLMDDVTEAIKKFNLPIIGSLLKVFY